MSIEEAARLYRVQAAVQRALDGAGPQPAAPVALKPSEIIQAAMDELVDRKPEDRSALDRNYAVLITKLEEAYAYARTFLDQE